MESYQRITIENKEYNIVDSIQDMRAEDSFIQRQNKLKKTTGNGEAKKWLGDFSSNKHLSVFFEFSDWGAVDGNGKREYPTIQNNTCFFSKANLLKYMAEAKQEYYKQEQIYREDISKHYDERLAEVEALEKEKMYFSIHDVSDLATDKNKQTRAYIKSKDDIWSLWRRLILPGISYLSILKLKIADENSQDKSSHYYFRVYLDYQYKSIIRPSIIDEKDQKIVDMDSGKTTKRPQRKGQVKFRQQVLELTPQCPFTMIKEDAILDACHIKPHEICAEEGRLDEAYDVLNGIAMTPTYHRLFDRGHFTILDDGTLICGTRLTQYTWSQLKINPNAKTKLRIFPEGRESYLKYHRENIFKDNLVELL